MAMIWIPYFVENFPRGVPGIVSRIGSYSGQRANFFLGNKNFGY